MLIHNIVEFCDKEYKHSITPFQCSDCNHPCECSGGCKNCLAEVHYPSSYSNGKNDYDCINMINFYVCDYINKYASEMLYLLRQSTKLEELKEYHVLSIGCGAAPDLMAFEQYIYETHSGKQISYLGIDKNPLWLDVHNEIQQYKNRRIKKIRFKCADVFDYFEKYSISETNVIVFQYVISHFYNTDQIECIQDFFTSIIKRVVAHKKDGEPLIILINDVNSCYRGRDHFIDIVDELKKGDYHGSFSQYYFNYNIKHKEQKYGTMHNSNSVLFDLSDLDLSEYESWNKCSSAQLLIEIEKGG